MSEIQLLPLKRFIDTRGFSINDIYEGISPGLNFQINYSWIYPDAIKAWHYHKLQTDFFCVIKGNALIGTCPTTDIKPKKHFIGESNPGILAIPPYTWHGIRPLGNEGCGLLYLVSEKYNPKNPDEYREAFDFLGKDFWKTEFK